MIKASLGYSVNFRLTCLIQIKTQRKKRLAVMEMKATAVFWSSVSLFLCGRRVP